MKKDLRSYILSRAQSPLTTVDQFKWDNLRAPRISDLFTIQDLQELHNLATSIRLSSKTKEKISMIDQIMYRRGFVRYITGTNRLTYRFIEDTSFLAKVAYNNVGTTDAPREFRNQQVLKPFVTRVFEYTPDGVLSIVERVEPITNREEFMSVAEDVYTLITEWLVGEYVFDDIGSNYFMNYGIRKGFGIVLLDFPYMFKVDYGKLICTTKDPSTMSGTCEGEIDYDNGFNQLYCTKCGAQLFAKDLAKNIEQEKVLIKGGYNKMLTLNLNITGGSKNVNIKENGEDRFFNSIPNKPITPVKTIDVRTEKEKEAERKMLEEKAATAIGVNGVIVEDRPEAVHEIDAKAEELEETAIGKADKTEEFQLEDDDVKEEKPSDLESPMIIHSDDDAEFKQKASEEKIDDSNIDKMFEKKSGVEEIKSMINALSEEDFVEIAKHMFSKIILEGGSENEVTVENIEDQECLLIKIHPEVCTDNDSKVEVEEQRTLLTVYIPTSVIVNMINSKKFVELVNKDDKYTGFVDYAGATINKKDIEQNAEDEKVFVLIGDNGNYITDKFGQIICISKIDNKYVNRVQLISNTKMQAINSQTNVKKTEDLKPGAINN